MKFELGTGVECDLDLLLRSRLLIQAMSGAGKSWLIRRILEQTFTSVQHFVLDSEGDFKTLREEFPYLLVAADEGDIPASAETAGPLAEKLLELSVPTILDISGLPSGDDGGERALFVANFLRGLLDAPQKLWHDALVILDEAQLFAPQTYQAVSRKTVNDAAGLVRKRGLGLILATNRLSELHKTTSAHLANKLIGRSMGIDADSASRQLGMRRREARELQTLDDGDFFAFGPAISKQVVRLHVGPVRTTHPAPGGNRIITTPSTPRQIKSIIKELKTIQPPSTKTPSEEFVKGNKTSICNHEGEIVKLQGILEAHRGTINDLQGEIQDLAEEGSKITHLRQSLLAVIGTVDMGSIEVSPIDEEALVQRILSQLPSNGQTVQVTPPEALRKKYLTETVERITERIDALTEEQRRAMEVLLSEAAEWSPSRLAQAIQGKTSGSSGQVIKKWQTILGKLAAIGLANKMGEGGRGGYRYSAAVESFAKAELSAHSPTDQELDQVVQHVLAKVATA